MQALRRHRLFVCCIAFVAVMAGVLLPSFSRGGAGGGAREAAWMEVCTALGMQRVPGQTVETGPMDRLGGSAAHRASDSEPVAPPGHVALEHCPWCTLGAHGALPPSPASAAGLPPALTEARFVRVSDAPRPERPACSAQPRAPPLPA